MTLVFDLSNFCFAGRKMIKYAGQLSITILRKACQLQFRSDGSILPENGHRLIAYQPILKKQEQENGSVPVRAKRHLGLIPKSPWLFGKRLVMNE